MTNEAIKDEVTQGQEAAPVAEKRASVRTRTLKGGRLAWSEQFCAVDCTVRDMSQDGARLIVHNPPLASHDLILHVPVDGFSVPCERVWAQGETWGVRFAGDKAATRLARHQVVRASLSGPAMEEARDPADEDEDFPPEPRRPRRAFGRLT